MMVTASGEEIVTGGTPLLKPPHPSPLLQTLAGKGVTLKEKIGAYMTLSERLKCDKDSSISREICQHTAQLTSIVSLDVMNDDAELTQAALQTLGFCLHLPNISSAFSEDDAGTIVKALCSSSLKTKDKSTCTRVLWCLSKQSLPLTVIRAELHAILCALDHALVQGDFQSSTVEYEATNVIIRLLETVPGDLAPHSARWAKLIFPLVVRSAHKIRERASVALDLAVPLLVPGHRAEVVPGLVGELRSTLVPELMKLFSGKNEMHVLKAWCSFVTLLGKALHKGGGLINCLLGIVEQGFKTTSQDVKKASFVAWRTLIDNFAIEPDVLYNAKRLKLLLQPLRATNAKQEPVAQSKLDTWWHLVRCLGPKAAANFEQVCGPLLQFAIGLSQNTNGTHCPTTPRSSNGIGLRQGFTTPLHRAVPSFPAGSPGTPRLSLFPVTPGGVAPPVFKSIQLQGVEMLARFLGAPSPSLGVTPKHDFTIDPLGHTFITSSAVFTKLSATLIPLVVDVMCDLGDQLSPGLLFQLWYSLVSHVRDVVTMATKKDSVEVFTRFLSGLQRVVGASGLPPRTLLKFLEAVSHLPRNVLGSPSYHTGNAGLMHGTPSLLLIELLFSGNLLGTMDQERFFCVLESLIDCGLTVPGTVLGFCGSVLQRVATAGSDITNKEMVWRCWSCIAHPLLEHIMETNEANQGDSLDHDFTTMYASLVLPVQQLLPCATLPQATVKTVVKTWSELYRAFSRCIAVVTTADSNLGCEELCCKMVASLSGKTLTLSQLDFVAQLLQTIANSIDFSSFASSAPSSTTPGGARRPPRPLGNLTSFVQLVATVTGTIVQRGRAERAKFSGLLTQSATSHLVSSSIGTMATVVSVVFTNVSDPCVLDMLLDKLALPVSGFYDNTGPIKCNASPAAVWQKLEKLWVDLCTAIQARRGGPYNSALLAALSPLLEHGLVHPKRVVKNHSLVFWNATFATVDSLEYPDSLRFCLAKLKEKMPLVLPGWTDTQLQVIGETPTSQCLESETSQSLLPPPPIAAPSPQKVHGSFLKRPAQAERLYVASSPEDPAKSASALGPKLHPRNVSPCRGAPSPLGGKVGKDGSPGFGGLARRRLHVDEESMKDFVFIAPSPKKTQVFTDHQKEVMHSRRVLPALYNDLEQSQDSVVFSQIASQNETQPDRHDDGKTVPTDSLEVCPEEKSTTLEEPSDMVAKASQEMCKDVCQDELVEKADAELAVLDETDAEKVLSFAGVLEKMKSELETETNTKTGDFSEEESSKSRLIEGREANTEEDCEDLLELRREHLDGAETKISEDRNEMESGLTEKTDLIDGLFKDIMSCDEKRNVEDKPTKNKRYKIFAKDSTDDEEGDAIAKKNQSFSQNEHLLIVPDTQQDSPRLEEDLSVSPPRGCDDSRPQTDLMLNLTPVLKLQKLKDEDLVRLSPDPTKCSFARLDINSSPKMFTSSEEETTPGWLMSRSRRLDTNRTDAEPKSKAVAKRPTRRTSRKSGGKGGRNSQAYLADLAEEFQLDGIEPLDDETDMDQSNDQLGNGSQSKQESAVGEPASQKSSKVCTEKKLKGRRKGKGKRIGRKNRSILYSSEDSDMNDSKCCTTDESMFIEDKMQTKTRCGNVDVKRVRNLSRAKLQKSALSPVEEALLPSVIASENNMDKEDTGLDRTLRKDDMDAKPLLLNESTAYETTSVDTLGSPQKPSEEAASVEGSAAEIQGEAHALFTGLHDHETECLGSEETTKPKPSGSAASSVSDSQTEELVQLDSCDDLFESCPKTTDNPRTSATASNEILASVDKPPRGKRKRQSWVDEPESDDDIPLAKIKHCYLDNDSQASDSDVDFPKLDKAPHKGDVTIKETSKYPKSKQLTVIKAIPLQKVPSATSPKKSPNSVVATRILKRIKRTPTGRRKSSPGKISPVATRLRRSQQLSLSVPTKPLQRPRRLLKQEGEGEATAVNTRSKFVEKLDKEHCKQELNAGSLSTSLPIPEIMPEHGSTSSNDFETGSVGVGSVSEKDMTTKNLPKITSSISLPLSDKTSCLSPESVKEVEMIPAPEEAEIEEILSRSIEGSDNAIAELIDEDIMVHSPFSRSFREPSGVVSKSLLDDDDDDVAAAPVASLISTPSRKPNSSPESPLVPLKFTPTCHSSPDVCPGARTTALGLQDSPSCSSSPTGSPGGILKRRDVASPSPSNKSRRVSFAEPISEHSPVRRFAIELIPPQAAESTTADRQSTKQWIHAPSPLVTTTPTKVISVHSKFITTPSSCSSGSRSRVSPSSRASPVGGAAVSRRVSPNLARRKVGKHHGFLTPSGRKLSRPIRQTSQSTQGTPASQATQQYTAEDSLDSDNQESVFPDLIGCGTPVERILPQLTSSMWSRGLGQLVRARNILTVGNLCSLSPSEIRSLPIRSPKISNLRRVMIQFRRQQLTRSGTSLPGTNTPTGDDASSNETATKGISNAVSQTTVAQKAPDVETVPELPEPVGPRSKQGTKRKRLAESASTPADEEGQEPNRKQARIVDKLQELAAEFSTEKLSGLPSERLFEAHQQVNTMMESIMAALKVKVKSPSMDS